MAKKKAHKADGSTIKKDDRVARYLHASGILMIVSSVFMITLPILYSKVYYYMIEHTGMAKVDWLIDGSVVAGIIIALLYCLLGLFVFRAGENNTRLAQGMGALNTVMAILAVVAATMIFMPVPEATFEYATSYFVANSAAPGVFPMFIMMLVDAALLVGMVCSVAALDDMCLIRAKKK